MGNHLSLFYIHYIFESFLSKSMEEVDIICRNSDLCIITILYY